MRIEWKETILQLAAKHGARNVRVFGSVASGTATSSSDLDLLVEMESGRSMLDLIGLNQDLEDCLPVQVEVLTDDGLSPYMRETILQQAVPL